MNILSDSYIIEALYMVLYIPVLTLGGSFTKPVSG